MDGWMDGCWTQINNLIADKPSTKFIVAVVLKRRRPALLIILVLTAASLDKS